jgi:hypothetical protein
MMSVLAGEEEFEGDDSWFAGADTVTVVDDAQDDVAAGLKLWAEAETFEVFAVVVEDQAVVEEGFVDLGEGFVLQAIGEVGDVGCARVVDEKDAGADGAVAGEGLGGGSLQGEEAAVLEGDEIAKADLAAEFVDAAGLVDELASGMRSVA